VHGAVKGAGLADAAGDERACQAGVAGGGDSGASTGCAVGDGERARSAGVVVGVVEEVLSGVADANP
jgi:hypothetical protein